MNDTGAQDESDCTPCDPGMYCPDKGQEKPSLLCAEGWYCERGAWSSKPDEIGTINGSDCYCPNVTTGGMCLRGTYCPEGSSKPKPCDPGSYCFFKFFGVQISSKAFGKLNVSANHEATKGSFFGSFMSKCNFEKVSKILM